jgi:hypothetical protein
LKLLDAMGIRRSAGVVTDFYGADGKPLWEAVPVEEYREPLLSGLPERRRGS